MDKYFTRAKLSNILSYDWIKILLIIVAVVFVWALAYTTGAPRASTGQTFDLFVYSTFYSTDREALLSDMKKDGAFSYDVLDFGSRTMSDDTYSTIMMAVTSVGEGDIFILSDFEEQLKEGKSSFRSFVDNYGEVAFDIPSLINEAKLYCTSNGFVVKAENGTYGVNESAIELYFRRRMEKDPRFRTEEKILEGVKQEIQRIKKVWNDANRLEYVITNHPELLKYYHRFELALQTAEGTYKDSLQKQFDETEEKAYGINLGKLTGGKKKITDYYYRAATDEESQTVSVTAEDIILCVFNYTTRQKDLQYETLGFVCNIIENCSNFMPESMAELIA